MFRKQNDENKLVAIATVSGMLKAEILKSHLQDAGIQAMLEYDSASVLFGLTANGLKLGQIRILVTTQNAEQAKQILNTPPAANWEQEATSDLDA